MTASCKTTTTTKTTTTAVQKGVGTPVPQTKPLGLAANPRNPGTSRPVPRRGSAMRNRSLERHSVRGRASPRGERGERHDNGDPRRRPGNPCPKEPGTAGRMDPNHSGETDHLERFPVSRGAFENRGDQRRGLVIHTWPGVQAPPSSRCGSSSTKQAGGEDRRSPSTPSSMQALSRARRRSSWDAGL